jgi:hypothetical protein
VKKYMAADNCRSGCLLVTVATERTWQHPDTGGTLDIVGLIEMLNDEARNISLEMCGDLRLMAKGLDLRPRLATEKESRV